jgi:hypothetical protein
MNNRALNAVIARCILDVAFASALIDREAAALREYDLDDEECSQITPALIKKVRAFAAFICKVQHNDLWDSFPCTRALMRHYGLEHEVFRAYAPRYQNVRAVPSSRAMRRRYFIDFLRDGYGKKYVVACPWIVDVALHERVLEECRANQDESVGPGLSSLHDSGSRSEHIPMLRGLIRIQYFRYDPLIVIQALKGKRLGSDTFADCEKWRCYWVAPEQRNVRLMDIDLGIAVLLSVVDGERTTEEVFAEASQRLDVSRSTADWLTALDRLVNAGMLTYADVGR